jgi:hypothetical protein
VFFVSDQASRFAEGETFLPGDPPHLRVNRPLMRFLPRLPALPLCPFSLPDVVRISSG